MDLETHWFMRSLQRKHRVSSSPLRKTLSSQSSPTSWLCGKRITCLFPRETLIIKVLVVFFFLNLHSTASQTLAPRWELHSSAFQRFKKMSFTVCLLCSDVHKINICGSFEVFQILQLVAMTKRQEVKKTKQNFLSMPYTPSQGFISNYKETHL